jgi:hypothetical protein
MNPGKTEETIIANLQREIIGKSLTVHQFAQLTMFNDFQETYGEAADGMTCSLPSESAIASLRVEAKPKRQLSVGVIRRRGSPCQSVSSTKSRKPKSFDHGQRSVGCLELHT